MYIFAGRLCVKTTPQATCEGGHGGGMGLDWLGPGGSATGFDGAADGHAPSLRWAPEVPAPPASPVNRALCRTETATEGSVRGRRPDDAIVAYDQPCILDGLCDPTLGGLGGSARRLPSRCERTQQSVRLGRRAGGQTT
jgi:hypothetical protein